MSTTEDATSNAIASSVTITDIAAAKQRLIRSIAYKTPVLTTRTVNQLVNSQLFFKCKSFQRTSSFKFRGANNALAQLSATQKQQGVITYYFGNHAQAIAPCRTRV